MGDDPEFTIQRNEVQNILEIPLKHFWKTGIKKEWISM